MKTLIVSALALALSAVGFAGTAVAQPGNTSPYAEPPPPPPPPAYTPRAPIAPRAVYRPVRRGLTLGGDIGIGSMSSDAGLDCFDCDGDPPAFALSAEIGFMISPRFALLAHGRFAGRQLDADGIDTLSNTIGVIAAKWWFTRRFWVKGGLGVANVSITSSDGVGDEDLGSGGAGLLALGFELIHTRRFALDLAVTGTSSTFAEDESLTTGLVSVGVSWF